MLFDNAACNALPYGPESAAYMDARKARAEHKHIRTDRVEFDAIDAKGRRHGYQIRYGTETFIRDAAANTLIDDAALGLWFTARPHALKDGKTFGALQSPKRFRTAAEAEAAGAAMIERARKAADKKK